MQCIFCYPIFREVQIACAVRSPHRSSEKKWPSTVSTRNAACSLRESVVFAFFAVHILRTFALLYAVVGISCARAEQPAPSPSAATNPSPAATDSTEAAPPPASAPTAAPPVPSSAAKITFSQCHVEGPDAAITFDDGPHGGQTPRLLKM